MERAAAAGETDGMRSSPGTPDERLLARYAKRRDPAALEELVRRYRPLARSLARRFRGGAALDSVPLDGDVVGAVDPGYVLVELRGAIESALAA